jgi:tetratricopeptide (TPR) repeat protein
MKRTLFSLILLFLLFNCTSQKNSEEFIKVTSGRYLFNDDEILEIHFEKEEMHAKWRGNSNIGLLKLSDSSFYMRELNEKILFVSKPEMHIELAPKTEHKGVVYNFRKLNKNEKTPSEYFKAKEFDKALIAFKAIQKKDPKSAIIRERKLQRIGDKFIRENDFDTALEIFKINQHLYPNKSNVFNNLGKVYLLQKDTANAILNFKKSLAINPENRKAKRFMNQITKKKK